MTEIADGPEIVEVDKAGNVIEPKEAFKHRTGEEFLGNLDKARKRGRLSDYEDDKPKFSDELLAEARDLELSEGTIRAGGDYRQLSKGKIYWLPLSELVEFENKDLETEDDSEFFDWFAGYVESHGLKTKGERTKRATRTWDDNLYDYEWKPQKMSNWWSNWGYSSSGSSGSELTRRLAIALKAINTTVGVINTTGKKFRVKLASEDERETPTSYTNFNEKIIVVSPQALLDTSIEQDEGIEITTAYGLHEASHVEYSERLFSVLREPTILRPNSVAAFLWNILEDLKIETLTGRKFPGFADYFTTENHYLWTIGEGKWPTTWGPKLNDKLNSVVAMAKFHADYEPIALADPHLNVEWSWWREWAEDYIADREPIRMGIIRALDRLAEDEDTKQELDDLAKQEEEFEQKHGKPMNDQQFKQFLDRFKEMLQKGGVVMEPCPSPSQEQQGQGQEQVTLTNEQAQELERLISEEYQQFEAFYKMKEGQDGVSPIIEVSKPPETDYSRAAYSRPGGMAERLRSVFFFRKKQATEWERLLKSGAIDEEELWRAGTGDQRVFERANQPEETNTSVTMLVDASGSMMGEGLEKAQDLANVMMACLRTQRGVRTRVRAHTTGAVANSQTSRIFRIWDPGDPDTRLGILTGNIPHGSNFDGFAIDWCAKELKDNALANESLLLIVLSDGLPAGTITQNNASYHYGGGPAMDHMKQVAEGWGRQGVEIVQIAIDQDGIRPEDQARMFKHWIGYESDTKLLVDLTKLLERTFGAIE